MKPIPSRIFWQSFIWASIMLSLLATYQTLGRVSELGIILWRSKWIFVLGLFALNIIAGGLALRWLLGANSTPWIEKFEFANRSSALRAAGFMLLIAGFSLVWLARLFVFGDVLPQLFPIFWVFLWASLMQALGLKWMTGRAWPALFAFVILAQGLIYQLYGHLSVITDYPFSMGYSEAGRHYYASTFFAKSLYGLQLPLPFLHPSRYFLMSLPFIVEGLPLWAHRAWQAFLWIGLTAISSTLLARRLNLKGWMYFFVAGWAFLYFLQGAVYYHLQVSVILILIGVSAHRPGRSLLFIILASLWAGVSRVNWFPVPAMLGIAIYLLETPMNGKGWRVTPFVWGVVGFGAALASQFVYIAISGNADARTFGSSFSSDLLWNRLLPNETFATGVLLGIVSVVLPLILALYQMLTGKLAYLHSLRWFGLLSLLLVLFVGGLVVSVKIGGGADLHNMDAFLVLLALIATSFFGGRVAVEEEAGAAWGQVHWNITAATLLIPLGFALPQIGFLPRYDPINVEKDVQKLQQAASEAVQSGGEVLFVTERQLLTFDIVQGIPLGPEYEQIELMEMAMSSNREYLEEYYADLENHRFAMIVAEEQKFTQQKQGAFVEENVAWVNFAGAPLLCAYKPIEALSSSNIVIFVPRPSNPDCRDPFAE